MNEKLKKMHSNESRLKAKNTRINGIKQLAIPEEQETLILLDYFDKTFTVYSTRATVLNRMARMGFECEEEATYDGEIFSRTYRFQFSDLGKFVRLNIFGVSSKKDTFEGYI